MTYRIEQNRTRDSFGNYLYRIYDGKHLVARYWHDFRGDGHGVEFVGGADESCPVGCMTDFIEGGGVEPLRLSARAIAFLDAKRPRPG